jgi:hypothetical protein
MKYANFSNFEKTEKEESFGALLEPDFTCHQSARITGSGASLHL